MKKKQINKEYIYILQRKRIYIYFTKKKKSL